METDGWSNALQVCPELGEMQPPLCPLRRPLSVSFDSPPGHIERTKMIVRSSSNTKRQPGADTDGSSTLASIPG